MPEIRLICGDAIRELSRLADGSVHCCITSPPYFGLRDYGMGGQIGLEKTPDCGTRGMLRLRHDLTSEQRAFVVQRLLALGLLDVVPCGTDGKE